MKETCKAHRSDDKYLKEQKAMSVMNPEVNNIVYGSLLYIAIHLIEGNILAMLMGTKESGFRQMLQ